MKGCRPFTNKEITTVIRNAASLRDKCLIAFCIFTGFRVQETLSIKVKDILDKSGKIGKRVSVSRINTKGKIESRDVLINKKLKDLLSAYVKESALQPSDYLFKSQKGVNMPISRQQAWRIFKAAASDMDGKIGTHSGRKTFAKRMYEFFKKDLIKTGRALNHKNINSTISYLSFDTSELDSAIEAW